MSLIKQLKKRSLDIQRLDMPEQKTVAASNNSGYVVLTDGTTAKLLSPVKLNIGDKVLVWQGNVIQFKWEDAKVFTPAFVGDTIILLYLITIAKPRNSWEMGVDELGNALYKVYAYKITSDGIQKSNLKPVITYDATGLQLVAQFGSDMNHASLSNYFTHEEEIGRLYHPLVDTPDKNSMWGERLTSYEESRIVGSSMAQKSLTGKLLASTQSRHNFTLDADGIVDYKEFSIVRNLLGTVEMIGKLEWFNPDNERYLYQYNVTAKKIITGQEDEDVNTVVLIDTRTDSYNWLYHVPILATKFNEVLARKVLGVIDTNPCSDSDITESLILGATVIDTFSYHLARNASGYSISGPAGLSPGSSFTYSLTPEESCPDSYHFWGSHPNVTIGASGLVTVGAGACGYFTLNATCGTQDGGCATVSKNIKIDAGAWCVTGGCTSPQNPGGLHHLYWMESTGYVCAFNPSGGAADTDLTYLHWAYSEVLNCPPLYQDACTSLPGGNGCCENDPDLGSGFCCYVVSYEEYTWGCAPC